MTRKQFLIIVVALAVLAVAGAWLVVSERSAWNTADSRIGRKLVTDLKLSDVAEIALRDSSRTLTLARSESGWLVKERADFPADGERVRALLLKLAELKIVQSDPVTESQRERLRLLEPGAARSGGSGTLLDLKDGASKTLARLVLGKKVMTKTAGAATGPEEGVPSGRYVLAGSDATSVALISDSLDQAEAVPEAWLAKELVRIERAKSVTAMGSDGRPRFAVTRDSESSDWKLAGGADKPDAGRVQDVISALLVMNLVDVAADPSKAGTGMKSPVVVKVQTFDAIGYTLRIGARPGDERYSLALAVSGEPAKARVAAKGESAEEKERQDKAFAERRAKLIEKLDREKRLEHWTYLASKASVEALLRERAQLLPEKKAKDPKKR